MSNETKLVIGIIIVSIGVTFLGIKLAYQKPAEVKLLLSDQRISNVNSPRAGSASSTVTIVEFADFECPACGAMHPIFKKLLAEYGDKISLVYRNFPIHKDADQFAIAALAAGKQGKFWEMHDMIFEHQNDWANLSLDKKMAAFAGYAATLGLDVAKYNSDLKDSKLADVVKKDQDDALAMGINSTPTIIINNNTVIVGAKSYEGMKVSIDAELQKAVK